MGEVGGGQVSEVIFMFDLLCDGNYRILALLWILIFDLYMILCSRQIIYLNHLLVVKQRKVKF